MATPHGEILFGCLNYTWEMIDLAIADLSYEQLAQMPTKDVNSIAWTLWHMSRVFDTLISVHLINEPQKWVSENWESEFNIPRGLENRGVGWSIEEVAKWVPPQKHILIGYYESVKSLMTSYIQELTQTEVNKTVMIPSIVEPNSSLGFALGRRLWDYVTHAGQISYIRGLIVGPGWYIR
ncbi:MAG TPA: hypothetical protein DEZ08_03135 [Dehalococcoidia bacterium]|jgi:hypothetical protein|nr:hypothetical protein [Dehalococcoidia bacterium]